MKTPRLLKADEIECRIKTINQGKGENSNKYYGVFLLYKDARVDMKLLDETYGPENWQRDHKTENGNLFGGIGVWDDAKKCWVWKWDAGSESNQDAEKGHASDSFKRAGFNWNIGRELYTAPFIFIELLKGEYYLSGDKAKASRINIYVSEIGFDENKSIFRLVLKDGSGKTRYSYGT